MNNLTLEKEILDILKKLLAFESTQHNELELEKSFNYVYEFLKNQNLFVKIFKSAGKKSMYVTFVKNNPKPAIILNGHLDVVDSHKEHFRMKKSGDKLLGRGVADMKGPLSVVLKLMADLSIEKNQPDCGLMIVTDEEIGGYNGTKFLRDQGIKPKFFMACEPSDEKIITDAKGVLWLKLTTEGKPGHAARPWLYPNPIKKMLINLKLYPQVIDKNYKKNEWVTTYNLTYLHSGKDVNQVPKMAEAILDIRYIPKDNPQKIITSFKKNRDWKVKMLMCEPAAYCNAENGFVKKLRNSFNNPFEISRQPGATDARFYSQIGVPSISFGPIGGGYHSEEEWVSVSSLIKYYHTLKTFLTNYER